jgi:hypothetical protein
MTIDDARSHYTALLRYLRQIRMASAVASDPAAVDASDDAIAHLAALGAIVKLASDAGLLASQAAPAVVPDDAQQLALLDLPAPPVAYL